MPADPELYSTPVKNPTPSHKHSQALGDAPLITAATSDGSRLWHSSMTPAAGIGVQPEAAQQASPPDSYGIAEKLARLSIASTTSPVHRSSPPPETASLFESTGSDSLQLPQQPDQDAFLGSLVKPQPWEMMTRLDHAGAWDGEEQQSTAGEQSPQQQLQEQQGPGSYYWAHRAHEPQMSEMQQQDGDAAGLSVDSVARSAADAILLPTVRWMLSEAAGMLQHDGSATSLDAAAKLHEALELLPQECDAVPPGAEHALGAHPQPPHAYEGAGLQQPQLQAHQPQQAPLQPGAAVSRDPASTLLAAGVCSSHLATVALAVAASQRPTALGRRQQPCVGLPVLLADSCMRSRAPTLRPTVAAFPTTRPARR